MAAGKDYRDIEELLLALNIMCEPLDINYVYRVDKKFNSKTKGWCFIMYLYKWDHNHKAGLWNPKTLTEMLTIITQELELTKSILDSK